MFASWTSLELVPSYHNEHEWNLLCIDCSVLSVFLSTSFSFPVALWHAVHLQDIWLSALSLNILSILINSRHLFSLCLCAVKFCFTCMNCIVLQIENRDYLIISFFNFSLSAKDICLLLSTWWCAMNLLPCCTWCAHSCKPHIIFYNDNIDQTCFHKIFENFPERLSTCKQLVILFLFMSFSIFKIVGGKKVFLWRMICSGIYLFNTHNPKCCIFRNNICLYFWQEIL